MLNNIYQVMAMRDNAVRTEARNRATIKAIRDTGDAAMQQMPALISGAVANHLAMQQQVGGTHLPINADALREDIFKMAFQSKEKLARVLADPASANDEDNEYGDGPGLLTAQYLGAGLHRTLASMATEFRNDKGEESAKIADALTEVSESVRSSLKQLKPLDNTWRQLDANNNMQMFVLGEAIKRYDPARHTPDSSVVPIDLMSDIARATMAGRKADFQKMKEEAMMKGLAVDPLFEDSIPDEPGQTPFEQAWKAHYQGTYNDPIDLKRYAPELHEEVPATVRADVFDYVDGYPTGMMDDWTGGQTPALVGQRAKLRMDQQARREQQMAEAQNRINENFTPPDLGAMPNGQG